MRAEHRRPLLVGVVVLVVLVTGLAVGVLTHRGAGHPGAATPTPSPPSGGPSPAGTAARRITGLITADASGIRDASGAPVRLLGVDEGRTNQCRPSPPDDAEAATVAKLGFNSVRLSVSWAATEPRAPTIGPDGLLHHTWDTAYLAQIDSAVAAFGRAGIAVVLDLHQVRLSASLGGNTCDNVSLPSWVFGDTRVRSAAICQFFTNTEGTGAGIRPYDAVAAVWQEYARRYASIPTVVAADVYNEPYLSDACPTVQRARLPDLYGAVGTAIRAINPRLTLILEDVAYEAYQKAGVQLTKLPPLRNVIYSWHFYPTTWKEGRPALQVHVDQARALGAPLWIGEFDGFGLASNTGRRTNADAARDLADMMTYCRDHGVSWSLWEYRGTGSSLIDPGTGAPKVELARALQAGF